MVRATALILTACALAACSDPTPQKAAAPVSAPAPAAPAAPAHHWIVHEDGKYGYAGDLSQDERNAGQAASEVQMFRYLGQRDSAYVLQLDDGVQVSCANPCAVVRLTGSGQVNRITFNPNTVFGAAFTDAINGQLEVYQPPARKRRHRAGSSEPTDCTSHQEGDETITLCK